MGLFKKPAFRSHQRKRDVPEGLWDKCPGCGEMIHQLALEENLRVCPKCDHHFRISARERIRHLADPDSFSELDTSLTSVDALQFQGAAGYAARLKTHSAKAGPGDAIVTGLASLEGRRIALGVMEFAFMGGSMGSVVGEKITRLVERATAARLPVILVSASGGARMYEGILSLLQMAKTCGALALHANARLPFISILTDPTTGGVSASFATVGDINIAEPKAMIGFAGPRVIKETTHQDLPPGFQTAEFLLDRGLIDLIVHRKKMRETLALLLAYLEGARAS
jgi:acetyl-CoA carboxylase carboxyl transferase subunit beta